MSYRDNSLPEWQVELAILDNLTILNHPNLPINYDRIENQYYLKSKGRYIDILLRKKNHFYIVELKGVHIDQESIITDQLLDYKEGIQREKNVSSANITCILASPYGFSNNVVKLAEKEAIILIELNERMIYKLLPKKTENLNYYIEKRIIQRRLDITDNKTINEIISGKNQNYNSIISSTKNWLKNRIHDDKDKVAISIRMKKISEYAPIMAHDINEITDFNLNDDNEKWWWLVYSILDKRGNASSFYHVKEHLLRKNLFYPEDIIQHINSESDTYTLELLSTYISESGISTRQNIRSLAEGIFMAAKKIEKYNFNFSNIFNECKKQSINKSDLFDKIWDFFIEIYGVGPRICSQIVRGLILKGGWDLEKSSHRLLEEQKHNIFIAKQCLSLIDDKGKFKQELLEFSMKYLDGNNAILSHILWYIRKKYMCTSKKPLCEHCPMSGYCNVYLNNVLKFDKLTGQVKITDFFN